MPSSVLGALQGLSHLTVLTTLGDRYYYHHAHFTDVTTDTQRV